MKRVLPQYIPVLIRNICGTSSVCNNAIWAAGEIAEQVGPEIAPYALQLLEVIVPLQILEQDEYHKKQWNRNFFENVAITIGRLCFACPEQVAPHLEKFVGKWCLALCSLRDRNAEKATAFRGLCAVTKLNAAVILKFFILFCNAIANYHTPPPEIAQEIKFILDGMKNSMGQELWQKYFYCDQMPTDLRATLQQRYQI